MVATRRALKYQRGNMNPKIVEGQATQWSNELEAEGRSHFILL